MFRNIALSLVAITLFAVAGASESKAEDPVLVQMYGTGVHAFFAKDYAKAHDYFTTAIKGGTRDPRCYYFRGLTYRKLGRVEESEMDFEKGSDLESKDTSKLYNVSKALERVQGSARVAMEEYRVKARLAALKEAERIRRIRYIEGQRDESRVLRSRADEAPEEPVTIPVDGPSVDKGEDPFNLGPLDKPADEPAIDEPAVDKPVIDEPGDEPPAEPPVDKPADVDPFGMGGLDEPGDEPPAEPPVDKPADVDPFGMGGLDEPGDEPPAEPPVDKPADADPFGMGGLDEPGDEPPAVTPPAGGGSILGALGGAVGKAITGDGEDEDSGETPGSPFGMGGMGEPAFDPADAPEEPAADPADPFGTDMPSIPGEEKAPEEPAADPADPFDVEVKPADSSDPFGLGGDAADATEEDADAGAPVADPADPFKDDGPADGGAPVDLDDPFAE